MGTQGALSPRSSPEKIKISQPIRLAQNPGCEPDAELIQFRKGIVGVYVANYVWCCGSILSLVWTFNKYITVPRTKKSKIQTKD